MSSLNKRKIAWITSGVASLVLINLLVLKLYPGDFPAIVSIIFILIPFLGAIALIFFRFSVLFLKRIAEKEEEEKLLREREKEIVENMVEGLVVHNKEGRILVLNTAAEKMAGVGKARLKGRKFSEVTKLSPLLEAVAMDTKEDDDFEYSLKDKNGREMIYQISKAELSRTRGEILKIIRDVSRARYLDKMKTEYVTIMSHKFLTPLTGIKWAAAALAGAELDETKKRESVKSILDNAEKLVKFTSYLLEITEVEEGLFVDRFEMVDLAELVEGAIKNYKQESRQKKLSVAFNDSKGGVFVARGDRLRLATAISNYLNNSIKYTPDGGKIDLSLRESGGVIKFSIKDDGIGVLPESAPSLFTKFFRDRLAKEVHTEGSGIGLFIVKNIIERHGGAVGYEPNKDGKGSTFYFTLPAYKEK
ncbi:MAG: PAS domain-containing sensor histidine kinase [Candidatus Pacebacteria bacterium]|nr:PAS domain-containing sensor histidine kinase [Candidatus Paceibacterota bacterium]NUQ57351.1 PAS domain S-box protein [Candidatus Paceibacter sp.]